MEKPSTMEEVRPLISFVWTKIDSISFLFAGEVLVVGRYMTISCPKVFELLVMERNEWYVKIKENEIIFVQITHI